MATLRQGTIKREGTWSLHDLPFGALEQELEHAGVRGVHTRALWRGLYREREDITAVSATFPPPLLRWLEEGLATGRFTAERPTEKLVTDSSDGLTKKFLLQFADGETVETVLMRYEGRN